MGIKFFSFVALLGEHVGRSGDFRHYIETLAI